MMAKKNCKIKRKQRLVERVHTYGEKVYDWCNDRKCKFTANLMQGYKQLNINYKII